MNQNDEVKWDVDEVKQDVEAKLYGVKRDDEVQLDDKENQDYLNQQADEVKLYGEVKRYD